MTLNITRRWVSLLLVTAVVPACLAECGDQGESAATTMARQFQTPLGRVLTANQKANKVNPAGSQHDSKNSTHTAHVDFTHSSSNRRTEFMNANVRRQYKVLMIAFALVFSLALAPRLVLAHAELVSANPAEGSTVPSGLTQITLTFSEELSIDQSSAELVDVSGSKLAGVTSAVSRTERTHMTLQMSALTAGSYSVKWQAITQDDNGQTNGTVHFTVAAPGGATFPGSGSIPTAGSGNAVLVMFTLLMSALGLIAMGLRIRKPNQAFKR